MSVSFLTDGSDGDYADKEYLMTEDIGLVCRQCADDKSWDFEIESIDGYPMGFEPGRYCLEKSLSLNIAEDVRNKDSWLHIKKSIKKLSGEVFNPPEVSGIVSPYLVKVSKPMKVIVLGQTQAYSENMLGGFISKFKLTIIGVQAMRYFYVETRSLTFSGEIENNIDLHDLRDLRQRGVELSEESKIRLAFCLLFAIRDLLFIKYHHRDIKPENCFIFIDGYQNISLRLGDYDVSAQRAADSYSNVLGFQTFGYRHADPLVRKYVSPVYLDVYSFGVVLFELFTGERLFEKGNEANIVPEWGRKLLNEEMLEIVDKCLCKLTDQEERGWGVSLEEVEKQPLRVVLEIKRALEAYAKKREYPLGQILPQELSEAAIARPTQTTWIDCEQSIFFCCGKDRKLVKTISHPVSKIYYDSVTCLAFRLHVKHLSIFETDRSFISRTTLEESVVLYSTDYGELWYRAIDPVITVFDAYGREQGRLGKLNEGTNFHIRFIEQTQVDEYFEYVNTVTRIRGNITEWS
jgi:serine/threonine protein kinase